MRSAMAPWQAAAPRLVGRSAELTHLRGRLDRLRDGLSWVYPGPRKYVYE